LEVRNPYDYRELTMERHLFWPTGSKFILQLPGKATIDGRGQRVAMKVDSLLSIWKSIVTHYNIRRKRPKAKYCDHSYIEMVNSSQIEFSGFIYI